MHSDIVVIGGGLSGLKTAVALHEAGRQVLLVEARDRLGGRILSLPAPGDGASPSEAGFDVGPTWFWPGQPRMARLVRELGLSAFLQQDAGNALFETAAGERHLSPMGSGMSGSYRLQGGIGHLVQTLAKALPAERRLLGAAVRHITRNEDGLRLEITRAGEVLRLTCDAAVLTLPPRLAVHSIDFAPALDTRVCAALDAIPTWMAGHAKALAFYNEPVWRAQGLSGSAISQRGPLMEIHDASPPQGGPFALFGFVGLTAGQRRADTAALRSAAERQLENLFGAAPRDFLLHDWAFEPFTATAADQNPLRHHPAYGLPPEADSLWDGRLILSGSETAPGHGGLLEGALEASDDAVARLLAPAETLRTAPIKGH